MASTWFPTIGPAQSLVWHAGPFGEFGPRRQDTEILAECPAAGQKQGSTGCRHIFLFVNSTGPEAFPHMLRDPAAFQGPGGLPGTRWPSHILLLLNSMGPGGLPSYCFSSMARDQRRLMWQLQHGGWIQTEDGEHQGSS